MNLDRLNAIADEVVERDYFKKLSPEEITMKRARFTNISLDVRNKNQEKKDLLDAIKDEIKPIQKEVEELAIELNSGFAKYHGKLFGTIDHDKRVVEYCNEEGDLIETRPATMEELSQLTIAHNRRAVNE